MKELPEQAAGSERPPNEQLPDHNHVAFKSCGKRDLASVAVRSSRTRSHAISHYISIDRVQWNLIGTYFGVQKCCEGLVFGTTLGSRAQLLLRFAALQ